MYRPKLNSNATALALIVFSGVTLAEQQIMPPAWVEIGSTLVASANHAGEPVDTGIAAFDVAAGMPVHGGQLSFLIEAETRPGLMTGSGVYSSVIEDQVRVSEFHYDFETASGEWAIGFVDSRGYIDVSDIANDDKTQFTNPVFVNNPTIDLPRNSIGLSWQHPAKAGDPGYALLLTSSGGPGAFIALETWLDFEAVTARLGAWDKSSDLRLPASKWTREHHYGFYAAIDGKLASLNWNARAGLANPGSRDSESFISIAAEFPVAANTLGIAAGRGMRGDHLSFGRVGEAKHIEVYYRYAVSASIVITPCIQFSHHGGPGDDPGTLTAGLRIRLNI